MLVIILAGLLIRAYQLGKLSLWYDEKISVSIAKLGGSRVISAVPVGEVHPPLYHVILHFWIALFGTSEIAVLSSVEVVQKL